MTAKSQQRSKDGKRESGELIVAHRKKQQKAEETYTQVIPVVSCSNETQLVDLMLRCGIARSATYNKLGSLQGWGLNWMFAASIIREICPPESLGMDKSRKVWEWSVNDCMKAIAAQQEAAKTFISRDIWRKYPLTAIERQRSAWLEKNGKLRKDEALSLYPKPEIEQRRDLLFEKLQRRPTSDPWLHRVFRHHYQRGHTEKRNQIVYQGAGYKCKRLTRNTVELQVMGIIAREKITLKLKCRHIISGQIRLIRNDEGQLEVHCIRKRTLILPAGKAGSAIGIDLGYTEAFYTSNGDSIADGLGKLMTQKTRRITRTNRNRYRLRSHAANNPHKAATILENNLGYKVKSRKLKREKATIQNFIRTDLRRVIISPTRIFAEDLTQPIKGKQQAKQINRLLNQWMKGELQASIEKIALETGSTVSVVNPAYTSQMCSLTGTLLGQREENRFTCYTGVVIQADKNAALNILHRGSDSEITRWMKYAQVRTILLTRTVRYLASIGKTVTEALNLGWLNPKFKAEANRLEAGCHQAGC